MRLFSLLAITLTGQIAFAQLKMSKIPVAAIPLPIHYNAKIKDAFKYTDAEGEHIAFITETGVVQLKAATDEDEFKGGDLYAYSYKMNNGQPVLSWQVHDFVKDCQFDVVANYLPDTFTVTDLNNDGKAEVWLMYRTTCRSDVSPASMKIIMYQSGKKYAMRGTVKTLVSTKPLHYDGGKYTFDESFKTSDAVFRKYAEDLWKKNLLEKWN
ncbi:M949_RS01915 family surface polysaccharide biosynthesis protein [Mucilaginibacter paludis]|uniref:FG-GAP repeat protein n=1 Tax=Mucilaginibacter paludis DSM 18603 TaxID=714943 RepID=H1Y310_9SPHI|nr:hypothetical protein [Mucilaginibacter paludis]EHQ28555.1 hypothetical protein Mucpa_4465 [Mucilaginibacter paludis DSM 18603]